MKLNIFNKLWSVHPCFICFVFVIWPRVWQSCRQWSGHSGSAVTKGQRSGVIQRVTLVEDHKKGVILERFEFNFDSAFFGLTLSKNLCPLWPTVRGHVVTTQPSGSLVSRLASKLTIRDYWARKPCTSEIAATLPKVWKGQQLYIQSLASVWKMFKYNVLLTGIIGLNFVLRY